MSLRAILVGLVLTVAGLIYFGVQALPPSAKYSVSVKNIGPNDGYAAIEGMWDTGRGTAVMLITACGNEIVVEFKHELLKSDQEIEALDRDLNQLVKELCAKTPTSEILKQP